VEDDKDIQKKQISLTRFIVTLLLFVVLFYVLFRIIDTYFFALFPTNDINPIDLLNLKN